MKTKYRALSMVMVVVFLMVAVAGSALAKQRQLEIWSMTSEGEYAEWAAGGPKTLKGHWYKG